MKKFISYCDSLIYLFLEEFINELYVMQKLSTVLSFYFCSINEKLMVNGIFVDIFIFYYFKLLVLVKKIVRLG